MSLWRGTLCANCKKEHECVEAERMFKRGDIAYGCSACVPKPQTNGDRIRAMSDEELANYLFNSAIYHAATTLPIPPLEEWLEWLRKESEGKE